MSNSPRQEAPKNSFARSRWADEQFTQQYRDDADIYLPLRHHFLSAAKSYFHHFIANKNQATLLDLGCGDGFFLEQLLQEATPAAVTLVDGSAAMLDAARTRLGEQPHIRFLQAHFQEFLDNRVRIGSFDFIFSSLAIHHLPQGEKARLYRFLFDHLRAGGHFLHYDVVLAGSDALESWYLALWQEWIGAHPDRAARERLLALPTQYKENADNVPDSLEFQLDILRQIGFSNVECFCKFGIFTLFGGSK